MKISYFLFDKNFSRDDYAQFKFSRYQQTLLYLLFDKHFSRDHLTQSAEPPKLESGGNITQPQMHPIYLEYVHSIYLEYICLIFPHRYSHRHSYWRIWFQL